jgi:hypothetical protein
VKESELKSRLARHRQIKLAVTGRKTGRTISIPVWVVLEGGKLYLLPVQGSDTQWYRNVTAQNRLNSALVAGAIAVFRPRPLLRDAAS